MLTSAMNAARFCGYMPVRSSVSLPKSFHYAGTTLVDTLVRVDGIPRPDSLVLATSAKERMTGGMVPNNSIAMKILDSDIPVTASGLVGGLTIKIPDDDGKFICQELKQNKVSMSGLDTQPGADTSFTWIPTCSDGKKVFIHSYGACESFDASRFSPSTVEPFSMVMLGYLNLLPAIEKDPEGQMQGFGEAVRGRGAALGVDFTDIYRPGFESLFAAAAKWSDFMVTNDMSLAYGTGTEIRPGNNPSATLDPKGLLNAAEILMDMEAHPAWIVIHMPEGGLFYRKDPSTQLHEAVFRPSLQVDQSEIVGTTGAGDNFAAGFLAAAYFGWNVTSALHLGSLAAAKSLGHLSATGSSGTLAELRALSEQKDLRPVPAGFEEIADASKCEV